MAWMGGLIDGSMGGSIGGGQVKSLKTNKS